MSSPNETDNENDNYFQEENLEEFTTSIDASSIFRNNENNLSVYDFVGSEMAGINIPDFFNMLYNFTPYLLDDINNYISHQELEETLDISLNESNNIERCETCIEFLPILFESINSEKDKECSICLSEFKNDDNISITKCSHIFHHNCITEWSHYKNDCPMCRELL
jgi:hypothetical protein